MGHDEAARADEGHTLYAIVDIFSWYIVGWQVTKRESVTATSSRFTPNRGSPMVAKSTAQLYVDLGVAI